MKTYFYAIVRIYEDYDEEGKIVKSVPYGKYRYRWEAEEAIKREWDFYESNCDDSTIEFKIVRWKKEYEENYLKRIKDCIGL